MDGCLERLDLSLHTPTDTDRRIWHFNVAFIGSCRAGKTKLLLRFVDSQFSDIYSQTTETSFVSKSVSIGRHHVVFQCWDTPGSARAGCLDTRLDQLHAVFIVFDASRDAIADLDHWHHLAAAAAPAGPDGGINGPLLVMVANKTDLGCHQGSMTRALDLCRARGGLVFSLSVLTDEENLEVDAMMLEVGKALTERATRGTAAAPDSAAAAAVDPDPPVTIAAISLSVTPQIFGDRVVTPLASQSPDTSSQSAPQYSMSQEQPSTAAVTAGIWSLAEGDASPTMSVSDAMKSETPDPDGCCDEENLGADEGWWSRVVCCCSCW